MPRSLAIAIHARGTPAHPAALPSKQFGFELQQAIVIAPPPAAVAPERAVSGNHPMARDDETHWIAPDRTANSPGSTRTPDGLSDLAVAAGFPTRNGADGAEDGTVPSGTIDQVQGELIERCVIAVEGA